MRFFLRQHRRGRAASGQRPAASGAVAARMKRIVAIGLLCSFVVTLLPATRYPLPAIFAPKAEAATGIYRPINYQGKVTSVNGSAVTNGAYNMRFKIFGAATGGNALWTETWSSSTQRVTMTGGLFSVALGTHVTMTGSVDFNSDSLYLQVEFDPGNDGTYEETFSPRRRFASVPYAHNADTLDGLSSEKFVRKDQAETMSGTLTIKPNSASKIGLDILSTAATSGTGGLRISTQGANHIVFGSGGSLYDVNLYRLRANVLKTDDSFYATGTISGATLKADALLSSSGVLITESGAYIDGSTFVVQAGSNRVGIGTASPDSALEVLGTVSGSNVYTIGSVTGTHLYAASTFGGAGLGDCDTAGFSKLLWDASTKRFSCGTDQSAFTSTGSLQVAFDNRYVNTSGDTMTGALVINLSSGTIGLEVIQTISGSMIFANDRLVSSGSLVTESGANIDAGTLYVSAGSNRVGINTVTPSVHLAVSGSVLFDARNGGSVGALHIDIDASTLVGDAIQVYEHGGENAVFRVTEDGEIVAFSGAIIDEGVLYVSAPSNRVGVNTINPKAALDVLGTASGTDLYAARSISGVNLYAATTFGGAGLADCDTAGASKLLWDASTKRFSCGSDQGAFTSTGSLQSAFDSRYVNQSGDTMTGALFINLSSGTVGLEVVQTISGSTIHANSQMRSSGSLVVEGSTTLQGAVTVNATNARVNYVDGSFSGVAGLDGSGRMTLSGSIVTLSATKNQPNMVLISNGNVGVGMGINTPGSRLSVSGAVVIGQGQMASVAADAGLALEVLGTASGTDLYAARSMTGRHLHAVSTFGGAGLADCDADGQTLGWDASTKQFTCGDDDSGGGSGSFGSGNVLTLGDARYVNQSGDTMTGALVISVTGGGLGTLGLRVLNTMSGAIVHAEKDLTSSGTLNIKGSARFQSGAVIRGAEDTAFLTLHDTTNNDGVTIRTGSGSPDGVVSAQLGSLFMDHASGRLYRNNNGTTGWVELMSGSGSVHMAKMTNNAGQSIADTSNTKIDFDTEEFDVGGIASTSTERFVIAKAGRYLVTASVAYQSASQTASFVYIYKNGSAVSSNFLAGGDAAFRQPAVTEVLNLAVGDYIEMYVTQTSGGSNTTHTQVDSRARMSVVQLQDNQGSNFWTMSGGNIYNNNASNVGIGTARPGSKLAVSGAVIISNNGLLSNASVDAGVALEVIGTVSGSTIHANNLLRSSGSLVTESGANLDAGTFYVAAGSNRVGINTLTPKAAFDVAGTMSGSQLIVSRGAFFSGSGITFSTTGSVVFNENSRPVDFRIEGDGNASLFFLDASADRIGIGTSLPRAALDVLGTVSGSALTINGTMSGRNLLVFGTGSSAKPILSTLQSRGAVGIGTAAPTERLTVASGSIVQLMGGTPKTLSGVNVGTNVNAVAVFGKYAYIGHDSATGNDVRVVDVASPTALAIVGGYDAAGTVSAIAVDGRFGYVGLSSTGANSGFLVLDLTNPSSPSRAARVNVGSAIRSIALEGRYAYVTTDSFTGSEFRVVDVSQPYRPITFSGADLAGNGLAVAVQGKYAYVGKASNAGTCSGTTLTGCELSIYDISTPYRIRAVGGIDVGANVNAVYVSGKYAYIANSSVAGNDFRIIDVANPASPSSAAGTDPAIAVNALSVVGKHAYLALASVSGADFSIVDLHGIEAPAATIGAIATNFLSVTENAIIQNNLTVGNAVNVGVGGIQSMGPLSIFTGSGGVGMTGAIIRSQGRSGALLALDGYMESIGAPHILFGYRGNFDTKLWRSGNGTLTLSGALTLSRGQRQRLIAFEDKTNNRISEVFAGSGSPVTRVSAGTGSLYVDNYFGKIYLKTRGTGSSGWEQVLTGSGNALDMASMTRDAAQSIPNNSPTKIAFDLEVYDVGGIADVSTNDRFDIKKAGKYLVTATHAGGNLDSGEFVAVKVYLNGSEIREGRQFSSVTDASVHATVTTVLDLDAGDYLEMYVQHNEGASVNTGVSEQYQPRMAVAQLNIAAGADLAEIYYTDDESIGVGDVVAIHPTMRAGVRKTSGVGDQMMLGVISTHPNIVMGGRLPGEDLPGQEVLLALAGRVPVKVSTESGPVEIGDALTSSSRPGVAMRADGGGKILGYALEGFDGEGVGSVLAFIDNSHIGNPSSGDFFTSSGGVLRIDAELVSFGGALLVQSGAVFGAGIAVESSATSPSDTLLALSSNVGGPRNTVLRVDADGNVSADGVYESNGADYAEYFFASSKDLKQGELVCIDVARENTVKRCDRDGDSNVIGIVSSREQAAFIGNRFRGLDDLPVPGTALVGLIGQLRTKVMIEDPEGPEGSGDPEDGKIRAGDQLAPASKPGFARKAKPGDATVGVALQPFDGSKGMEGEIDVLISRRNQSLTAEAVEERVLKTIADMEIDDEVRLMVAQAMEGLDFDEEVRERVGAEIDELDLDARIARIVEEKLGEREDPEDSEEDASAIEPPSVAGDLTFSGTLAGPYGSFEKTLSVGGDARIGGDLHLEGALIANDLFVPGALSVDGLISATRIEAGSGSVFNGLTTINGDLALNGRLVLGSGAFLKLSDLIVENSLFVMGDLTIHGMARFLGDLHVKGELVVGGKQAGHALIPKTGTSVTVLFQSGGFVNVPVVTASPDVPVLYAVSRTTQTGFTIRLSGPAEESIGFSWLALATEAPALTAGVVGSPLIAFPIDSLGYPLSSNDVWNGCIRNRTTLDASGQPYSCSRYHVENVWTHPDLAIEFTFNGSITPPYLKLPAEYEPTVTQLVTAMPEPEPQAASSASSSAASSEAASLDVASSSAASEQASSVQESSVAASEAASSAASAGESSVTEPEVPSGDGTAEGPLPEPSPAPSAEPPVE